MAVKAPWRIFHRVPVADGVIYTGSLFLQRVVTALLLPFYVRSLGPSDYGEIALMASIAGAAVAILGFGLEAAIFRGYYRLVDAPEDQRRFLYSVGLFLLVVPMALVVISLTVLVFISPVRQELLVLGLIMAALQTSTTIFPFAVLRARERPWTYAWMNFQCTVVLVVLLFVLVILLHGGAVAAIVANVVAWATLLPQTIRLLSRYQTKRVDFHQLREALKFGLPLVPHTLSHWGLALSDRLVLSAFVSANQIGVYNAGYQAGAVVGLVLTAINWSLMPAYGRHVSKNASLRQLQPIIVNQVVLTLLVSLIWAVAIPPLLRLALPASFSASADLVPWVVLGYTFYGLYLVPMNLLSLVLGETRWVWLGTGAAAVVNVGFNLIMVPRHGIEAAAIGTALAYGVLFIATSLYLLGKYLLQARVQPMLAEHA